MPFNNNLDSLRQRAMQFEQARGMFNQNVGTFDQSGSAQVQTMNAAADSLYNAQIGGKITEEEYLGAIDNLHNRAERFAWNNHTIPEDQIPGNISVSGGVQRVKTAEGYELLGYDPGYVEKNSIPIGDTGQIAVPTGPGKGYTIVDNAKYNKRDVAGEEAIITGAQDGIRKIFDQMMKDEVGEGKDKTVTPERETEMMALASRRYISDRMQAKHVTRLVNDEGLKMPGQETVLGNSHDPHLRDMIQNASAGNPTPSPSPSPSMDQTRMELRLGYNPSKGEAPIYEESKKMPGTYKEAGYSEERTDFADLNAMLPDGVNVGVSRPGTTSTSASDLGINPVPENAFDGKELPTVRAQNSIQEQLIEAGMMETVPTAYSKGELDSTFKGAANGTVVGIADGRRFMKKDGKWMETPYSDKHTAEIADQRIDSLANYLTRKGGNPEAAGKQLGAALKKMTPGMREKALTKLGADMIPERLGLNLGLTKKDIIADAIGSMDLADERTDAKKALAARNKQINDKLKSLSAPKIPEAALKQVQQVAAAPPQVQQAMEQANTEDEASIALVSSWFDNPVMVKSYDSAKPAETPKATAALDVGEFFKISGKFYYKAGEGKFLPVAPDPRNKPAPAPTVRKPSYDPNMMDILSS